MTTSNQATVSVNRDIIIFFSAAQELLFTGSDELEVVLNASSEFTQAFTALTANNEILDFTEYLQEKATSTSLVDYINSDSTETDLLSLAAKYSAINAASGSLETLWSISHDQTPYTYVYT